MKNKKPGVNLEIIEGRSFIVGREGHIYIDSSTASKQHAEIRIIDGKVHLRDLDSTNGTYLVKDRGWVRFDRGFVDPQQYIAIGGKIHVVMDLLAIANDFAVVDGADTEIEVADEFGRRAGGARSGR
ncbi:MAG: FHA domain-containing protein [Gammaproteobacteria bacterium]|jgi:pSer/pThr/pTyr-binding forkhead associated (FHA) protein